MQYMALIYTDPQRKPVPGTPAFDEAMKRYFAFTAMLKEKGAFIAGDPLKEVETATSIRVKDGRVETMDGPFAETKEHLGGYYLFDAPDIDTAIRYGAMIPAAGHGTIEIRPVMSIG
ncbi:YciI family protein [Frigidibacter sp. RF13]|uniref:YciI family protein n=1 Tax=Frigidibacter sp. RF13 TaxID=2997340 RepID=UPI00226E50D1|nr:YciI family protein [Frigidibacter sp. RF13]MCY1127876.1 YciI family protein [Frigidibacter sp. RF13]